MSSNHAVQYDGDFAGDHGVANTARKPALGPQSFTTFWQEYYSRMDRKLEAEINPLLKEFTQYPVGWDSYTAPPLREDTKRFALQLLNEILRPETPLPQVIPSSVGGVQFEWHEKDVDLELHVTAPFEITVWFYDHLDTHTEPASFDVTNNFAFLKGPIDLLTSR